MRSRVTAAHVTTRTQPSAWAGGGRSLALHEANKSVTIVGDNCFCANRSVARVPASRERADLDLRPSEANVLC